MSANTCTIATPERIERARISSLRLRRLIAESSGRGTGETVGSKFFDVALATKCDDCIGACIASWDALSDNLESISKN